MAEQSGTLNSTCGIIISRGVNWAVLIKQCHVSMSAVTIIDAHAHHPTKVCQHTLHTDGGGYGNARTIVYGDCVPAFMVLQNILHVCGAVHLQFLFQQDDSSPFFVSVRLKHVIHWVL